MKTSTASSNSSALATFKHALVALALSISTPFASIALARFAGRPANLSMAFAMNIGGVRVIWLTAAAIILSMCVVVWSGLKFQAERKDAARAGV